MGVKRAPELQFEVLPLRLAYTFLESNGLGTDATAIRTSHEQIGSHSTSTSRRAKIVALLRGGGLLDKFIEMNWPHALTAAGKAKLEFYERLYSEYQSGGVSVAEPAKEEEAERGTEFALEEHLRDYLSKNLAILEPGLSLWPLESDEDAIEFQVNEQGPSRRIDILAKDRDGSPVVIELKVSRGHERAVGQALYYRAKIKQRFGAKQVRIFIVAAEISPELRIAASEVSDTFLFEYSLSMKVNPVKP